MPRAARRLVPARERALHRRLAQRGARDQHHGLLPRHADPLFAVPVVPARQQAPQRLSRAHVRHVRVERLRGGAAVLLEHRREHGRDRHAQDLHQARAADRRGIPLPGAQVRRPGGQRVPAQRQGARRPRPLFPGLAPCAPVVDRVDRVGERAEGLRRRLLPRPHHQDRAHLADQPAARRAPRLQRRDVVGHRARAGLPDAAGSAAGRADPVQHPAAAPLLRGAPERLRRLRLAARERAVQFPPPGASQRAALHRLSVDLVSDAPELWLHHPEGRLPLHALQPERELRGAPERLARAAHLEPRRGPVLRASHDARREELPADARAAPLLPQRSLPRPVAPSQLHHGGDRLQLPAHLRGEPVRGRRPHRRREPAHHRAHLAPHRVVHRPRAPQGGHRPGVLLHAAEGDAHRGPHRRQVFGHPRLRLEPDGAVGVGGPRVAIHAEPLAFGKDHRGRALFARAGQRRERRLSLRAHHGQFVRSAVHRHPAGGHLHPVAGATQRLGAGALELEPQGPQGARGARGLRV